MAASSLTPLCSCSVDLKGTFENKGIKDAESKLQKVAAEVRDPWPQEVKEAEVDTLMMKHFLSGFDDADAKTILKHISDIQKPKSHILLFQVPLFPPHSYNPAGKHDLPIFQFIVLVDDGLTDPLKVCPAVWLLLYEACKVNRKGLVH